MTSRYPWSVYTEQLTPLGHGFPLYYPESLSKDSHEAAQIGDVGIIVNGGFRPFFNVINPHSPKNQSGQLPANFEPLLFDSRFSSSDKSYLHPGVLHSHSVRSVSIETSGDTTE